MNTSKDIAILLTPVMPLPNSSGLALRAWDWLLELGHQYQVHVLVTNQFDARDVAPSYPASGVWSLTDGMFRPNRLLRLIGLIAPVCGLFFRGLVVDWLYPISNTQVRGFVRQLGNQSVKRIVVFRFYLHDVGQSLASLCPDSSLELDMDDLESATRFSVSRCLARMGRPKESLRFLLASMQYALLERFMVKGYDAVWLAAKEDTHRLSYNGSSNLGTRPNKLECPKHMSDQDLAPSATVRLLFVGSLDYPPNQEAVLYLLNQVQPLLEQCITEPWTFCVVGRRAPQALVNRMAASDRVEFFPDADELTGHYINAHVVLVPLLAGGGTKLKTIEAFAHRRPVISSSEGVRGLSVKSGVHYLHAQTGAEFAQAIAQLMGDLDLADRVSRAGQAYFLQHHRLA